MLDSWAVLALFDEAACAPKVQAVLDHGHPAMSTVNIGEVAYRLIRRYGDEQQGMAVADRLARSIRAVPADWSAVRDAARIKAQGGLAYADAFCVATAQRLDAPLWTGDPEIIALAGGTLEVVDLRHTP